MIALMNLLLGILEIIIRESVTLLIDAISSAIPSSRKEKYTAHFIKPGKILSKSNKGFCLTGDRSLSIEDESFSHALVTGPSGSQKTSGVLIPSLLNMAGHSSMIVHDPSGELYTHTSGAFANHFGYKVKILNYSSPAISQRFNPYARAKTISDGRKINKAIVRKALGESKDAFFNLSAEGLLTFFNRFLLSYSREETYNLSNVLYLVNTFAGNPEKIDKLIVNTGDAQLLTEYKAWVSYGENTLKSIVASARAALSIFEDPSVSDVTWQDTLCFEQFRSEKTILYITNSVKDMKYYSVISGIFFDQFLGHLMSRIPSKDELPIFFMLDECSSLYMDQLSVACSNLRKHRAGMCLIFQQYQDQLSDLYGHAQARSIAANTYAKVFLPGQPLSICQELETILGKFTYTDENIQRTRSLRTADEIRQSNETIILCGNHPPISAKLRPYYTQPHLKKLTSMRPFEVPNMTTNSEIPLVQFD